MTANVKRIKMNKGNRIIVISDIHGNVDIFKKLLNKINFTFDDILFIVGDIVEKGPKSLETLRYIMELQSEYTIYVVRGNCDDIALMLFDDTDDDDLRDYLLWRKHTLINEMCRELSLEISKETDMKQLKKILRLHFQKELQWIKELPDIIETDDFYFVHAGLTSDNIDEQDEYKVRKTDAFLKQGFTFKKYCIVGHWPVVLYSDKVPNCNPIIDCESKIICIDGGNILKRDGQLNALIILNEDEIKFSYDSYDTCDDLKEAIVLDNQDCNKDSFIVSWVDNKIEILEAGEELSYCVHKSTNKKLWILNKYMIKENNYIMCEDSTDYRIAVKSGDKVKIVETTKEAYLIKKDGITGWYYGQLEMNR